MREYGIQCKSMEEYGLTGVWVTRESAVPADVDERSVTIPLIPRYRSSDKSEEVSKGREETRTLASSTSFRSCLMSRRSWNAELGQSWFCRLMASLFALLASCVSYRSQK